MIIGNKAAFAFEVGEKSRDHYSHLREVNIYIAGQNASLRDNSVYAPHFIRAVWDTAEYLKQKLDYHSDEDIFFGQSIEQAHKIITRTILSADDKDYADADDFIYSRISKYWCEFLDWGETTDGIFSFLFPISGKLYLTLEYRNETEPALPKKGEIFAAEITPYAIIKTCEEAIDFLDDYQYFEEK